MSQRLNELLLNSKTVAITAHIDPDADAIASCILTKIWIKQNYQNIDVKIFLCGNIDELYSPLLENEFVFSNYYNEKYDIAIVLDSPNAERTGFENLINNSNVVINVDHHETNTKYGDYNIVADSLSSTGEIMYRMLNKTIPITDKKIAELTFHSIITDTACFSSLTMSKRTREVLFEIRKFGIETGKIKDHYFSLSPCKKYLLKTALESMDYLVNDRVSYMEIYQDDIIKSGGEFSDTLGIVDKGLRAHGVDIAIILIEKEKGLYYISLRGTKDVNVADIALKMGGGGHDSMAAFQSTESPEEIKYKLAILCSEALENIENENYDSDIFKF